MPLHVLPNGIIDLVLHLRLRPGRDDDLIAWLESIPEGRLAAAVRGAMRGGIGQAEAGEEDEDVDLSGLSEEL